MSAAMSHFGAGMPRANQAARCQNHRRGRAGHIEFRNGNLEIGGLYHDFDIPQAERLAGRQARLCDRFAAKKREVSNSFRLLVCLLCLF